MMKMSSQSPKSRQEVVQSRSTLRQRIVLGVMMAGLALLLFSVTKMALAYRRVHTQRVIAETELKKVKNQYETLSENVERLSTPRGREEELRTRYRAVLPGETLVVVLPDTTPEPEPQLSFWDKARRHIGVISRMVSYTAGRLFGTPDSDTIKD